MKERDMQKKKRRKIEHAIRFSLTSEGYTHIQKMHAKPRLIMAQIRRMG